MLIRHPAPRREIPPEADNSGIAGEKAAGPAPTSFNCPSGKPPLPTFTSALAAFTGDGLQFDTERGSEFASQSRSAASAASIFAIA